jgi:hypothetical protein
MTRAATRPERAHFSELQPHKPLRAQMPGTSVRAFSDTHEQLIQNGYSPLPIILGTKRPACDRWSEACRAPLDRETRERFARRSSGFGLGVALGYNDVVAIDLDVEDHEIVAALRSVLPRTPAKKRGQKGATGFFRLRGAQSRRFKEAGNRVLIEILGPGCQTVSPPTTHPATGRRYEWIGSGTLLDLRADGLPELPPDIINQIEGALRPWLLPSPPPTRETATVRSHDRYVAAVVRRRIDDLAVTAEGGRNTELNAAAFRLARLGLGEGEVFEILAPVAAQIGLEAREIARTVHSAWTAGTEQGERR